MMKANNEPEKPVNTFSRVDFGDGGYARIDQTATDTTNVVMYHTYFNQDQFADWFCSCFRKLPVQAKDNGRLRALVPQPAHPTLAVTQAARTA